MTTIDQTIPLEATEDHSQLTAQQDTEEPTEATSLDPVSVSTTDSPEDNHTKEQHQPTANQDPELIFIRERLQAIEKYERVSDDRRPAAVYLKEERSGVDGEKIALEELEKSTLGLWTARKLLADKKAEIESSTVADDDTQVEIAELEKNLVVKEHQWSATKEVYHREYGPIAEENNAAPVTEIKAKAEHDIKMLQDQIANLQRQLNAVSIRRKEMAAEAEEQHKRLALTDDDE
ncbi:hypothetical protein BGZ83_008037 [Gryganskiella cystojenkinii]|nr:hypothetical protein BGZ83_008037 [Gryganskiella cystojenkinii]